MSQNVLPILIEKYIFEIKFSRPRGHPFVNFRFNEVGVRTEITRLPLVIVVVQPTGPHSKRKTKKSLNKRYHEKTSF